ncbi:heparan-alpha-glucosaminide N-acetyltransferase domain-containing protein [Myxococcota bacterium]|nr:heparan-alpha-glucosaminide N-acetyltransferase domain-containing protein [Myxococcota bacterium]
MAPPLSARAPLPRALELDAMRTLAIVLMAASHVTRIIKPSVRDAWCAPSLLMDPLIQGMFMGLVGASLAWSWRGAQARGMDRAAWLRARSRRAAQVYLVGVLLFFFDKGAQLPWLFLTPGILADIALAIVVFSFVASSRRPVLGALALTAAGYAAFAWLTVTGVELRIPPINAANAPLLPNTLISGLGLAAGIGLVEGRRGLLAGLGLGGLLLLAASLATASPAALLGDELGRSFSTIVYRGDGMGLQNTWGMLTGAELADNEIEYFNPTLRGQPFVLGMLVVLWLGFRALRPLLARVESWLFLPGRESLGVYVFHLLLVGLPVAVMGRAKPLREEGIANAYMLFVLVAIWGFSWAWPRLWRVVSRRGP